MVKTFDCANCGRYRPGPFNQNYVTQDNHKKIYKKKMDKTEKFKLQGNHN